MATTITMPQLGETVTEGTVAQWLKNIGDEVEKYEAFVEVSTDKVNAEVPSPVSGVLREIIAKEGETVPTGAPIAVIDEVGSSVQPGAAASQPDASVANGSAARQTAEASRHGADEPVPGHTVGAPAVTPSSYGAPGAGPAVPPTGGPNGAPSRNGNAPINGADVLRRVSPAVRKLAREHQVDLVSVEGTGTNGRITANDVLAAAREGPASVMAATIMAAPQQTTTAMAAPSAPATQPQPGRQPARPETPATRPPATGVPDLSQVGRSTYAAPVPGTLVPLSPARKIIAQRMVQSLATAPHAWTMCEVDVTKLWAWRNKEKTRFQQEKGYGLTLLPFFIYATVQALRANPLLNSKFTDEGIYVQHEFNIGIAIGLDANLMVPVIRDADTLSIGGLAIAAGKLIEKARTGKLGADELGGGTFTVNNTGANGSVLSKPIINGGQAAIVTMEAVVKRPVVVDDAIAIRSMMNVCLSLDHRVLDGTTSNAFLNDLKKRLEAMKPGDAL
ncbi:MAG: 2-oxo acid dehydrogenase subunit E2 [Candidatus Eremiobacteraeota bacterium]|nr:2-oxo acid dehydrogenase subunit E2 [Candidatus Eremiobacteraeota bacterium]MBC5802902.1 2-oxo acid dehydrogenase subunit E2 [Candidatus Eremiobacteraeota bacterium]MBC5821157.1 2-oxo acid dehydrogenase subunit E2 [Candidatus Eremiobacteraeota bacterium]